MCVDIKTIIQMWEKLNNIISVGVLDMAETDGGNQLSSGNNNQKVIRAPSLKRGKEETRLSHRVSEIIYLSMF